MRDTENEELYGATPLYWVGPICSFRDLRPLALLEGLHTAGLQVGFAGTVKEDIDF